MLKCIYRTSFLKIGEISRVINSALHSVSANKKSETFQAKFESMGRSIGRDWCIMVAKTGAYSFLGYCDITILFDKSINVYDQVHNAIYIYNLLNN